MPMKTCSTCGKPYTPTSKSQSKCAAHGGGGRASRSPTTRAQNSEYRRLKRDQMRRVAAGGVTCHWCGCPLTTANASLDHVVPVAQGGGHDQMVDCCTPCNNRKGDRSAEHALRSHTRARSALPSVTRAEAARQLADQARDAPLKVFIPLSLT